MSAGAAWWRTCEVCGHSANEPEVQPSIGKLPDKLDSRGRVIEAGAYLDVVRCRRAFDCMKRAEALGRPWPFVYPVGTKPTEGRR